MAHDQFSPADKAGGMAHLVEETGEVLTAFGNLLSALGKTQRFGMDSENPLLPPEQRETNREWLARELDDMTAAIARLRDLAGIRARPGSPNALVNIPPLPDGSRAVLIRQDLGGRRYSFALEDLGRGFMAWRDVATDRVWCFDQPGAVPWPMDGKSSTRGGAE